MSKPIPVADIEFTNGELQKLFKNNYNDFSSWEHSFLIDINRMLEIGVVLSEKQIYYLYRAYYRHVEGDPDAFEDWCREKKMMTLYNGDYSHNPN